MSGAEFPILGSNMYCTFLRTGLRTWSRLPWRDRFLVLRVTFALTAVHLALTFLSFKTLRRRIEQHRNSGVSTSETQRKYVRRVSWAVRKLGRKAFGAQTCLLQALTIHWLLGRKGFDTSLNIGVTKDSHGQLMAHAWVEWEDTIVIGGRLSPDRYVSLHSVKQDRS